MSSYCRDGIPTSISYKPLIDAINAHTTVTVHLKAALYSRTRRWQPQWRGQFAVWTAGAALKWGLRRQLVTNYVISFPKSGRTWLLSMLALYVRELHDGWNPSWDTAVGRWLLYKRRTGRRPPVMVLTHDCVDHPFQDTLRAAELRTAWDPSRYEGKRNVFLIRDPRDVVVSYFYHKTRREALLEARRPTKVEVDAFVRSEFFGIPKIVAFMNQWAELIRSNDDYMVLRYEDLHESPEAVREVIAHFDLEQNERALKRAIEACSFERMQRRELEQSHASTPAQMKVRRGIIGGYRDDLAGETITWMESYIRRHLSEIYGEYH